MQSFIVLVVSHGHKFSSFICWFAEWMLWFVFGRRRRRRRHCCRHYPLSFHKISFVHYVSHYVWYSYIVIVYQSIVGRGERESNGYWKNLRVNLYASGTQQSYSQNSIIKHRQTVDNEIWLCISFDGRTIIGSMPKYWIAYWSPFDSEWQITNKSDGKMFKIKSPIRCRVCLYFEFHCVVCVVFVEFFHHLAINFLKIGLECSNAS